MPAEARHTPDPARQTDASGSPAAHSTSSSTGHVVHHRLPAGEVARAGLVLIGLGIGVYLLWRIHEVVFLFFLAILVATAIEPIVNRLRRGPFSRSSGTLAVYTVIVLAIVVPLLFIGPSLMSQTAAFMESIPHKLDEIRPHAERLSPRAVQAAALTAIDRVRERFANPAPPREDELVEIGTTAAETLVHFLTVFVVAFYWMVERASIKKAVLRIVPPARAKDVNTVWVEVEQKLGGWVRGQLLVMLVMAVISGIGFFLLGLPNPVLLGVIVGVCEAIPLIGPYLGFAPAFFVALMVEPYLALLVVAFAVIVQQLEGNILLPRVMDHVVGVSPLTVVLGILVGAILYGLPGAFVAVPVAAAIQVILAHVLGMEDVIQATAHPPVVDQEATQEARQASPDDPIYQQHVVSGEQVDVATIRSA